MELQQLVCYWEFDSAELGVGIVVVVVEEVVDVVVVVELELGVVAVAGAVVEVEDAGRHWTVDQFVAAAVGTLVVGSWDPRGVDKPG